MLVDGTPLSDVDLARLKAKQGQASPVQRAATASRRPSLNWRETLRWTVAALARELQT